ncbi:MAG: LysR family transcriptional regulator [Pseudomonas sp.]|nr:LysR family transcriptional regulator [Pseudomonas sp.]
MNPRQLRRLRSVNLNLIPVLAELLDCRNVTHAAARLHLTQSAVSASLKRLREIFDDELLVMSGREMVLTEKAMQLVPAIEQLLASIDTLVEEKRFDPATSVYRFRVVTADYVSAIFVGKIGKVLADVAPGISMHVSLGTGSTAKEIQMGQVDMLVAPERLVRNEIFNLDRPDSGFQWESCLQDCLVGIESAANPVRSEPISLEEYLSRPHVSFSLYHNMAASVEQDTLAELGLTQNDRFIVPYFTLLPSLVTSISDSISVVPASLACQYAKIFPIRTFRPPVDFPTHNLVMVWGCHRSNAPELVWLRELIRQAAQQVITDLDAMSIDNGHSSPLPYALDEQASRLAALERENAMLHEQLAELQAQRSHP